MGKNKLLFSAIGLILVALQLFPCSAQCPYTTEPIDDQLCDTQPVKEYINDYFLFPFGQKQANGENEPRPSGWDLRLAGGKLSGNDKNFLLSDTSDQLPLEMKKTFERITYGRPKLDLQMKFDTKLDGASFTLSAQSDTVIQLQLAGGQLCLLQPDGSLLPVESYITNEYYGFAFEIDLETKSYDFSINGVCKAKNQPFVTAADYIDTFTIHTGDETVGNLNLLGVHLYRGYAIHESFTSSMKRFPDDWETVGDTAVVNEASSEYADAFGGQLSNTGGTAAAVKKIERQTGKMIYQQKIYLPHKTTEAEIGFQDNGTAVFAVKTKNGYLGYTVGNGDFVELYEYQENLWQSIYLEMDLDGGNVTLKLNGKLLASDIAIFENGIDEVYNSIAAGFPGEIQIDDIRFYSKEEPEDYVSEPVLPAKTTNLDIGMQMCSLWREGTHYGWDWIAKFPEFTPYLGFYEEGSPEVADWEIKWMAEHGVTFQYYCWYRPNSYGSQDEPLKTPSKGAALHDGFMNARYSDTMKFCFMWENLGAPSKNFYDDLLTNLAPYWIEYYFKDPRYYKIDGRPLLAIYSLETLQNQMGEEKTYEMFVKFKELCVEAGVGEPILIISGNPIYDATTQAKLHDAGFDGATRYNWGNKGVPGYQKKAMLKEMSWSAEAGDKGIETIPSVAMGFDASPWEGGADSYRLTPEEFQSMLEWVRDEFPKYKPKNNFSRQPVITSTWNEYGEGHILAPAGSAGFAYLDAIRNVVTAGGEHTDIVPTDKQKDRFTNLYPFKRVQRRNPYGSYSDTIDPPIPDEVQAGWYFDTPGADTQGWYTTGDFTNPRIDAGEGFTADVSSYTPVFGSPTFHMNIDDVTYINLRMRTRDNLSFLGRVEITMESGEKFTYEIGLDDNDVFHEYYIPVHRFEDWNGNIKSMTIVPGIYPGGDVTLASVEFLADTSGGQSDGIALSIDGRKRVCDPEPILRDGEVMLPLRPIAEWLGGYVDYDAETGEIAMTREDDILKISPDCAVVSYNGTPMELEKSPIIENGVAYLPLRMANEIFSVSTDYRAEEGILEVNTKINDILPPEKESVAKKRELIYSFEFNRDGDTEGFYATLPNFVVKDGILSMEINNADPNFETISPLSIPIQNIQNISVRMKNGTPMGQAAFYFKTDENPQWNEGHSIYFETNISDSQFTVYNINASILHNWGTVITGVRMDPSAVVNGISEIDYIRFEGDYTNEIIEQTAASSMEKTNNAVTWNFDQNSLLDGWEPSKGFGNIKVNGELSAQITSQLPELMTRSSIEIEADKIDQIKVRMKNMTDASEMTLYFTTDTMPEFTEENFFKAELYTDDTYGESYLFHTETNPNWKGTIKNLKLVMPEGTRGSIVIDYIKLFALEGE